MENSQKACSPASIWFGYVIKVSSSRAIGTVMRAHENVFFWAGKSCHAQKKKKKNGDHGIMQTVVRSL